MWRNTFLKNSTVMFLSKNHDPVMQNNLQILLWDVLCRDYFLTYWHYFLTYIKCPNKVCGLFCVTGSWFLERDSTDEFFKCIFVALWPPFSPIILERRQKSLQLISPKLSMWINSTTGKILGWPVPLNWHFISDTAGFPLSLVRKARQL